MIAYVFPGQGAQFVGMGKELFLKYPEYVRKADEILGYSIEELCSVDGEEKLNLTQYTQPALFVVSALSYLDCISNGRKPDVVAGHSLGEYNALFAAGVFSFETGLSLVKKRGELMSQANGGAMAAIIGLKEDEVKEIIRKYGLDDIDISNLNTPKQTVIASTKEGIERAQKIFEKEQVRFVRLKVSAAFHSRYMKEAQTQFADFIEQFSFHEPCIPVISNYTAQVYKPGEIKENLIMQLGSTVRWVESVWNMEDLGCSEIKEIGPGNVLTNMIRKIKRESDRKKENVTKKEVDSVSRNQTPSADEMVEAWNKKYEIGTEVTCAGYDEILKTRTQAVVLFGHRAAIYMEQYKGYFDLRETTPISQQKIQEDESLSYELYLLVAVNEEKTNTYFITDRQSRKTVVIDPAVGLDKVKDLVIKKNLKLEHILLTHGHQDHTSSVSEIQKKYGCDVYISKRDAQDFNCSWEKIKYVEDGEIIRFGETSLKAISTPGHSLGSMCYQGDRSLFSGDTLFTEGCGNCGQEGSNTSSVEEMYDSLAKLKRWIPENTLVFPGHTFMLDIGVTMEELKRFNLYLAIDNRTDFIKYRVQRNV